MAGRFPAVSVGKSLQPAQTVKKAAPCIGTPSFTLYSHQIVRHSLIDAQSK
jgi:hypothetical protein